MQISAEEAQRVLKDMVFDKWLAQGCEERTDTLKMVSSLDVEAAATVGAAGARSLFTSALLTCCCGKIGACCRLKDVGIVVAP